MLTCRGTAQVLHIITYQGGEDEKLKKSIESLRDGVTEMAEVNYVSYPNWWERAKDWQLDYIQPYNIWYVWGISGHGASGRALWDAGRSWPTRMSGFC